MQLIDKRKFLVYSGISTAACIFSIIFIKADFFIYRIINGLFIGGFFWSRCLSAVSLCLFLRFHHLLQGKKYT